MSLAPAKPNLALADGADTATLASLLPYVSCGTCAGLAPVHVLADASLGYALELGMPAVETDPEGEEGISSAIEGLIRDLPAGIAWQWFFVRSPWVEDALALYATQPGHDAVGTAFASRFTQRWRDAQQHGFFPAATETNLFPSTQRLVLAIKSAPLRLRSHALARLLERAPAPNVTASPDAVDFTRAARVLFETASALGFAPLPLDGDDLANLVADLLFPGRRFVRPPLSVGAESIREAIGALGRIDQLGPRGFRTVAAGCASHHRLVSMMWHPRSVRAGMLNAAPLLRPRLSIVLTSTAQTRVAAAIQLKSLAFLNLRTTHRFNETETSSRAAALQDVEQRILADGERLLTGRLQIHVAEDSAEAADRAALDVAAFLQSLDIEAGVEDDIGASLLLRGCLPFAVYGASERKFRRQRRFLSRDWADLHPAGSHWTGMPPEPDAEATGRPAPIVMYRNPAGAPLFVDPSKAERNPHALVIGQSGSGKSFFVHDYLLHLWRLPDVRLYLISIKPDYRKLALLLGRYVEITLDAGVSLNPFGGEPTLENQALWFAVLALMITEGRPDRSLDRADEVALQGAAMAAAVRNWDGARQVPIRETLLEHVCVELEHAHGATGRHLAGLLHPYRRGPYRRLFNAPRTLSVDDRFVFFNLGQILKQPCSPVVSLCVFGLVNQVMYEPRLRGTPKGLIADEVWALAQDPFAAAILDRSLKAYRSLGGFAIPIVQDPKDLDTTGGRVLLVNTATKYVLPLDHAGQADLDRFVRLNERERELVRGLRLVKRRYSEFFVSIEGFHSGKGMLIPDPLRYAISTTDPADEERLERYYRDCGDMFEAVRRFAAEAPFGLIARDRGDA
jgi:hypothetical protein